MRNLFFFVAMLLMMTLDLNGQAAFAIPNEFHGYILGSSLGDFESKNKNLVKTDISIPFTNILTKGTIAYILMDQLTEANDKIDITFFFYNDLLAVICVQYKTEQSREEFQKALKAKYGNLYKYDDKAYRDPSSGNLRTIENIYWEKSDCCVLCFTSADSRGQVSLTFADKPAQAKLKSQDLKRLEKKIE